MTVKHFMLGITFILFGIGIVRLIYKNPNLFGVLMGDKTGIYLFGIISILTGILELFGFIDWH